MVKEIKFKIKIQNDYELFFNNIKNIIKKNKDTPDSLIVEDNVM